MQVYSSLPPFPRMMELLQSYVDDAKCSYDPLGVAQYTISQAEKEYGPEDFDEMLKFIKEEGLPIIDKSPQLDILGFNYVHTPFDPDVPLPSRGTARSAGYDFFLPCDVTVGPEPVRVMLGVSAHIPESLGNYFLAVFIRSGISKSVRLVNGTGIIDADYEHNPDNNGDIGLMLQTNPGVEPITFKKGDRIAQGIFLPFLVTALDFPRSSERIGGFGSTDKQQKKKK